MLLVGIQFIPPPKMFSGPGVGRLFVVDNKFGIPSRLCAEPI